MKKIYEKPALLIKSFSAFDVLTSSNDGPENGSRNAFSAFETQLTTWWNA